MIDKLRIHRPKRAEARATLCGFAKNRLSLRLVRLWLLLGLLEGYLRTFATRCGYQFIPFPLLLLRQNLARVFPTLGPKFIQLLLQGLDLLTVTSLNVEHFLTLRLGQIELAVKPWQPNPRRGKCR